MIKSHDLIPNNCEYNHPNISINDMNIIEISLMTETVIAYLFYLPLNDLIDEKIETSKKIIDTLNLLESTKEEVVTEHWYILLSDIVRKIEYIALRMYKATI